jgi:hypothetical protein
MRQLDAWHLNAGVHENLNIVQGQRLKMNNSTNSPLLSGAHQRKRMPNFDIEFSQLQSPAVPSLLPTEIESDDDLPDPDMLIKSVSLRSHASKPSSSSSYDIDDLIRAIPQEELDDLQSMPLPPAPSHAPKRARETDAEDEPASVRRKILKTDQPPVAIQAPCSRARPPLMSRVKSSSLPYHNDDPLVKDQV